jgi:RNA polymerase sigma-70 factor, ECF subfamily
MEELLGTSARLRVLSRALAANAQDADDLVQATYLRALENWSTLSKHMNMVGWLIRTMRNLNIDETRRASSSRTRPLVTEPARQQPEAIATWRLVDEEDIHRLVESLAPDFRAVWSLLHEEGLDQQQIAVRLGIPRATVATRMLRTRRTLRRLLERQLERQEPLEHSC